MIYLDLDGCIFFGSPSFAIPISRSARHDSPDSRPVIALPTRSLHHLCTPGSWEYAVARLLQRVQEARELLHQDLQEISEPLAALTSHQLPLSPEQHAVARAVEQDYRQACLLIDQALAQMLQHFPTEIAALARLQKEKLPQTITFFKEKLACLQEEQSMELTMPGKG